MVQLFVFEQNLGHTWQAPSTKYSSLQTFGLNPEFWHVEIDKLSQQ